LKGSTAAAVGDWAAAVADAVGDVDNHSLIELEQST
jgi:hypothetical protein